MNRIWTGMVLGILLSLAVGVAWVHVDCRYDSSSRYILAICKVP